jgi:hypothetical protein
MTKLIKKCQLELLFPNAVQRKAFLDIMKGMVELDPMEDAIVLDIVDPMPVIIKRNGKIIYQD